MENRDNIVAFRLTDTEKGIFDRVCRELDITPSQFARYAIQWTQDLNADATDYFTLGGFVQFVKRIKARRLFG